MLTVEQLKERKLGLGGSDIAVLFGLSKYKTLYQLWLEKTSDELEIEENQYIYWGNKLEAIVIDEFASKNNVEIVDVETIIHPEYPFLRGNLDGFIPSLNAVLEAKTSSGFMASEWGESGTDVIPMPYLLQVAFYCMLKKADCAYIAVLIGGNDYREFKYIRNLDIENAIIEKAKEFWHYVETLTPPPPENQIDLKLMFPKHEELKAVSLNPEIGEHLQAINDARFKIKELSETEEKHKFEVMQFMKDAECLVDNDGRHVVTWKANKRGSRTFLIKKEAVA